MSDAAWSQKGGTLSDKSARKEFGLTQEEIERAIRAGKLQYRMQSVYGNPFLRLLRKEVEALVGKKHGNGFLQDRKTKTELSQIERELRSLKKQVVSLEHRRGELLRALEKEPKKKTTPRRKTTRKTKGTGRSGRRK